jgi:nucleotidyltransferase substrate binding protein (TIGR01987 family)
MERNELNYQILQLKKAYNSMKEWILKQDLSLLERDWVVQRFEYTIEITWKTLRKVLKYEWLTYELFPKEVLREFYSRWIIEDLNIYLDFLDLRNSTFHNYSEDMVEEMFDFIKMHYSVFEELIFKLDELI